MGITVVILGAGIAGLAAAARLAREGLEVHIVEARDRVGGRIWTVHDPLLQSPIELGAEFVHGKPREIWKYFQASKIELYEGSGSQFCHEERLDACAFFEQVQQIMDRLKGHGGPDIAFQEFLDQTVSDERLRQRVLNYVMGFHGADPREASVVSLAMDTKAGEETEGDRVFRIKQGYGTLVDVLLDECERSGVQFHLHHTVDRVEWSGPGVNVRASHQGGRSELEAEIAVVTVPVGVLRLRPEEVGHMEFVPPLGTKSAAMEKIASGHVRRISLAFSEAFWKDAKWVGRTDLADLQFLFSNHPWFPTWWTTAPSPSAVLTGWSPALKSDQFAGQSLDFVRDRALDALSKLLSVPISDLEDLLLTAYSHDWIADPVSRGAYSYARVGGADCFRELAEPVSRKLYFAGEATNADGHHGTVHGALASGERAATEILRDLSEKGRMPRSA